MTVKVFLKNLFNLDRVPPRRAALVDGLASHTIHESLEGAYLVPFKWHATRLCRRLPSGITRTTKWYHSDNFAFQDCALRCCLAWQQPHCSIQKLVTLEIVNIPASGHQIVTETLKSTACRVQCVR